MCVENTHSTGDLAVVLPLHHAKTQTAAQKRRKAREGRGREGGAQKGEKRAGPKSSPPRPPNAAAAPPRPPPRNGRGAAGRAYGAARAPRLPPPRPRIAPPPPAPPPAPPPPEQRIARRSSALRASDIKPCAAHPLHSFPCSVHQNNTQPRAPRSTEATEASTPVLGSEVAIAHFDSVTLC
eukprot:3120051-Rhodomonas_salina.1